MNDVKGVWIDKQAHDALKKYCNDNGKKMGFVVEQLIRDQLCQKS